jgi:hypothetical protein
MVLTLSPGSLLDIVGISGCNWAVCFKAILSARRNVTIPSHISVWPPVDIKLIMRKKKNTENIKPLLVAILCMN